MRNRYLRGLILAAVLGLAARLAYSEEVTISTYYPSPYGSYQSLETSSDTHLATASGNVGIGTTEPLEKLTLVDSGTPGNGRVVAIYSDSEGDSASMLSVVGSSLTGGAANNIGVEVRRLNTDNQSIGYRLLNPTADKGWIWRMAQNSDNLTLDTVGGVADAITVLPMSGNVGIGAPAPTAKLEVGGDVKVTGGAVLTGNTDPTYVAFDDQLATKAYVDAAAGGGPTAWTCTVRCGVMDNPTSTVSCVGNEKVVSGGCNSNQDQIWGNAPSAGGQGWTCTEINPVAPGYTIQACANCCE